MRKAVGGGPSVQAKIIGAEDIGGLVFAARGEDSRIEIKDLGISVIQLEAESASSAPLQRHTKGVVIGSTEIPPGSGVGDVGIWAERESGQRSALGRGRGRQINGALRDSLLEIGGYDTAAEASRGVRADLWLSR